MENSDNIVALRERQTELIKIIESIDELMKSKAWNTLKELVFDGLVERIERLLLAEAKGVDLNFANIFRLQGELAWARRYSDLGSFAEVLKRELEGIKQKIKQ